ncbi:thiamine phosphate synthase [Roseiconus nitratireducens]|uniref:Thiamine-phosphate synthase n=1 Tax=Roseiconus nitratireducens TaxID=2605748 RepID=A0A5M6D7P0_9BACT|nr:thiamine phosphate synthase [Roseiconus nitratireducens]
MVDDSFRAVYRILDASANRANEGFRTLEEFVRFGLENKTLVAAAKQLRHDFAQALARLPRIQLVSARDASSDVGASAQTVSEYHRKTTDSVITAAIERVQQSLRVLEEYGKIVDPAFGRDIEAIRYRAYNLHRDVELQSWVGQRLQRLADSRLYVLIDCMSDEEAFLTAIRKWAAAGVDIFQLRDKAADDRTLYQRALIGAKVAAESDALFVINDRPDLAVATDADGVHVGQDELPPGVARRLVGPDRLVGVSTHDLTQVHAAIDQGADYIGCGPTFPGRTKQFDSFAGPEFLRQVHAADKTRPLPAFAIGGITAENLGQVTETGFHRVAVSGAVTAAADPVAEIQRLKRKLESGR